MPREHPSSFDSFSDYVPSSVHSEPNSVHCECEPPDPGDDSEPLEVSIDSFCEWAPCPADWYEPIALDSSSKVLEISPIRKSSITSDFFIPTFGSLGDRFNGSDEPPDTGIFARLPKPRPPKFPPQAASCTQVRPSQSKSVHPETIPKQFHRVAAGSSTQPARSPPFGDAMS